MSAFTASGRSGTAKTAGRLSEEEIQAVIAYITAQLGRDAE